MEKGITTALTKHIRNKSRAQLLASLWALLPNGTIGHPPASKPRLDSNIYTDI